MYAVDRCDSLGLWGRKTQDSDGGIVRAPFSAQAIILIDKPDSLEMAGLVRARTMVDNSSPSFPASQIAMISVRIRTFSYGFYLWNR